METLKDTILEAMRLDELNKVSRSNRKNARWAGGGADFMYVKVGDPICLYQPSSGAKQCKVVSVDPNPDYQEKWATSIKGEPYSWDGDELVEIGMVYQGSRETIHYTVPLDYCYAEDKLLNGPIIVTTSGEMFQEALDDYNL